MKTGAGEGPTPDLSASPLPTILPTQKTMGLETRTAATAVPARIALKIMKLFLGKDSPTGITD
jgi:hypothetical protein